MCPEFCGTSGGYLPLKYQNADGTANHYGFLRINMEADPGTPPGAAFFVSHLVWESSPNMMIMTHPIPEPAAVVLLRGPACRSHSCAAGTAALEGCDCREQSLSHAKA